MSQQTSTSPRKMPANSSDNEHSDSERPGKAPRRIVDLDPDDGDGDWEDLPGLGTSTHRSRNPAKPVIPIRKRKRSSGGTNARASALKRRTEKSSRMQDLADELDALDTEREERAVELSEKYGVKLKEVRRRMMASSGFATKRRVSLYNAKISAIMRDLNEGREVGNRLNVRDVKAMVKRDPSMLDGFTEEEEAEMVTDALKRRALQRRGARGSNLAAGADARRTVERLMQEITALAERAGMLGFAMFTRGHLHDRTVPVTIESWGALDFFREVMKKDPADVSALFELWAVSRERGSTGADTLLGMQKECTAMIKSGLIAVAGRTKIAMNYENYISALVEGKNMGLLGWPEGAEFKRMSKQSAIGPLRILRDALRSRTCKWKVLTAGEKSRLLTQFKYMVKNGEATEKVRRKTKGRKAGAGATARRSTRIKSTRGVNDGSSGKESSEEEQNGSEDEDEDEDDGEDTWKSTGPGAMRERLLALVERKRKEGRDKRKAASAENDAGAKRRGKTANAEDGAHTKRKRNAANAEDNAPSKRKRNAANTEAGAPSKRKRNAVNADDDAPAKRMTGADDERGAKRKEGERKGGKKRRREGEDEEEEGQAPKKKKGASKRREQAESAASATVAPTITRPKPRRVAKKATAAPRASTPPDSAPPPPRASVPPESPASPPRTSAPPDRPTLPPRASTPAASLPRASAPPNPPALPPRASTPAASPPHASAPPDPPILPPRASTPAATRANVVKGKRGGPPGRR
ncbi:hypothetical protein DFH09DRAFT_1498048 [Mycena vulgaris]|nr:hypothetical protein DFH09DRAFT_1498048 [Mycena vulgaris]